MKALPQASAGPAFHNRNHGREVEGRDAGDHAERLAHRVDVDAGAGALGIFAFHQLGRADGVFDDFEAALNVAFGIGDGLAVLARQELGQEIIFLVDEIEELHQHARAPLRIGGGPAGLGGLGIFDSGAHFGLRGQRHLGAHLAGHRFVDVREAAGGPFDPLAADEMGNRHHGANLPQKPERAKV